MKAYLIHSDKGEHFIRANSYTKALNKFAKAAGVHVFNKDMSGEHVFVELLWEEEQAK